jgi:hypothetical protein
MLLNPDEKTPQLRVLDAAIGEEHLIARAQRELRATLTGMDTTLRIFDAANAAIQGSVTIANIAPSLPIGRQAIGPGFQCTA